MSIVPLVKITAYGRLDDKELILEELQRMGCVHLIPLRTEGTESSDRSASSRSRDALEFLLSCPRRRTQVSKSDSFDAQKIEQTALELKNQILELEDQRDFLQGRIENLKVWGEFSFPPVEDLSGIRLWFYVIPHMEMKELETIDSPWTLLKQDNRFSYVVVLSKNEPEKMPVERVRTGAKPLSQLKEELEETQLKLEDLGAQRWDLTRWCRLFAENIHLLENKTTLKWATRLTHDDSPVFALRGWAPKKLEEKLQGYAQMRDIALEIVEPEPEETPPTLLENERAAAGGQSLVTFYQTPNYWLWDPSGVVFYSFALFFAMILSDAGYAAIMAFALIGFWKKLGEGPMRCIFSAVTIASVIWGLLVGSYFGLNPPEASLLGTLKILDLNDANTMMLITIIIGVVHVVIGNAADAYRRGFSLSALAPLGWVGLLVGGFAAWQGYLHQANLPSSIGYSLMGLGAVAVLLFTSPHQGIVMRTVHGLLALTKVSNAFGDVLSYLRLFALGLASASLALTFNSLAVEVAELIPGLGVLLAFIILLFGHVVNFALAIVSGVVHGLRLNFIEFFNWGLSEEGFPFRAFARKEGLTWNQ